MIYYNFVLDPRKILAIRLIKWRSGDLLDYFIREANSTEEGHKQLCAFAQVRSINRSIYVSKISQSDELKRYVTVYNTSSCARKDLVYDTVSPDATEREEVVVTLQGYVLRCNLPPITRPEQYVIKNPKI